MRYACKHLFFTHGAVGVGAISVVPGRAYSIDKPLLAKTRDESHRVQIDQLQIFPKITEVQAPQSMIDLSSIISNIHGNYMSPVYAVGSGGGTPYPFEASGVFDTSGIIDPSGIQAENIVAFLLAANMSRVPVDTYLSVAIYSVGRKALVEALSTATYPIAVNGQVCNNPGELYELEILPADVDPAPQIIVNFTNPADTKLFRLLPLAAEFATIDNLQSSLQVPIIPDREILLLVPEVKARLSQIAPAVDYVPEITPETLLDDIRDSIDSFISDMMTTNAANNFAILNVEGVFNCNISERELGAVK